MNKFQYNSEPYKLLVGLYIWSNFYRRPSYVSYMKKKLTVKIIDQQTHKPQKQNFAIHNTTPRMPTIPRSSQNLKAHRWFGLVLWYSVVSLNIRVPLTSFTNVWRHFTFDVAIFQFPNHVFTGRSLQSEGAIFLKLVIIWTFSN